jgi:hypothetical protein
VSLIKDVIDAVTLDLDTHAGLPKHATVRYRRPRAIMPDDCPLLVVWPITKSPTPQTTEVFDSVIQVAASWHVETVEEAQTLIDDEALSLELINAIEMIEARIRHMSINGIDVEQAWEVLPSDVLYLPPEMQAGLVEGYHASIVVRATETAPTPEEA